eukprot:CAMPEP_0197041072 /NCGR_PEP_ID=MMETSP1384-20130603/17682_1 /TAXON_ID=29189 /ORGANISM="Ammonia sp." /LENGTH=172 /DNA_ID=CAMNT_0042471935 /DNA_START=48 /DNA_END=566 /DNA_ORIENTATION=-
MAERFGSVAGAKVAYLKQLKFQDWHRKRLVAHIRSNIFGSNEQNAFIPSKSAGRKVLTSRLKGPIMTHFYSDNDDRVLYSMTRNRKAHLEAITAYEQMTLFPYRRRKPLYWKYKMQIQTGKRRLAEKLNCQLFPPAYKYHPPVKVARLKRRLRGRSDTVLPPDEEEGEQADE